MTVQEIRNTFLNFFEKKGHKIVPSAPLVIKNDPTLMFTNAGMNPFKDIFLGNRQADATRVANTQKCLRVSGKHNDLEEVGIDTYHHTLFEMLGNWSFGDYFKEESIAWAWELITEIYGLPKDRLYVTVFGGDAADKLDPDTEAADIWKKYIPEDRILFCNKKDNFWEMGDTGPCGPCSEIHIDLRSESERAKKEGKILVNADHPQVVEIWNLVFIQFNRSANGSLSVLPAKHVDTGMGLERLCMAMQGKQSNYDTDVFQPLISTLSEFCGIPFKQDEKTDIALRVIADHIRAIAFAIADGELPSNNRAGYVIKRILRRAVRYGYTFLAFREPFMYRLMPVLSQQFSDIFPEIGQQEAFISKVIFEEEASFLRTLDSGLKRFDQIKETAVDGIVDGQKVFELYDTFGFPVDLTALIAREQGLKIDEKGFEKAMDEQKNRSRAAAGSEKGDWVVLQPMSATDFLGYDHTEAPAQILQYREVQEKKRSFVQVVLNATPFYAESGGQIGDTGYLMDSKGTQYPVLDTVKENDSIIHILAKLPSNPEDLFHCHVDAERRNLIMNNHSATHLLHAALRTVLGAHVSQKGSFVGPDLLRFDFSHFSKMSQEEIDQVNALVNEGIRKNISLNERRNVPISEAKNLGAMALFGEKYGEFVRVIQFGESVELCGGTHVPATGQIGFFKITSESSIAAGVRRIEAVTAQGAEEWVKNQEQIVRESQELLNSKDVSKSIQSLLEERSKLLKEVEKLQVDAANLIREELFNALEEKGGKVKFIARKVSLSSAQQMKQIAFDLRNQVDNLFLVLASEIEEKPQIAVMISDSLVSSEGLDASKIVRELAKEIQGGGGGQAFYATAGGKNTSGLNNVVEKATSFIAQHLSMKSL